MAHKANFSPVGGALRNGTEWNGWYKKKHRHTHTRIQTIGPIGSIHRTATNGPVARAHTHWGVPGWARWFGKSSPARRSRMKQLHGTVFLPRRCTAVGVSAPGPPKRCGLHLSLSGVKYRPNAVGSSLAQRSCEAARGRNTILSVLRLPELGDSHRRLQVSSFFLCLAFFNRPTLEQVGGLVFPGVQY